MLAMCFIILPPSHPSQSAVLFLEISHRIPADVSMYSGLYKTSLSSSLSYLRQVLAQSHTTVSQQI